MGRLIDAASEKMANNVVRAAERLLQKLNRAQGVVTCIYNLFKLFHAIPKGE